MLAQILATIFLAYLVTLASILYLIKHVIPKRRPLSFTIQRCGGIIDIVLADPVEGLKRKTNHEENNAWAGIQVDSWDEPEQDTDENLDLAAWAEPSDRTTAAWVDWIFQYIPRTQIQTIAGHFFAERFQTNYTEQNGYPYPGLATSPSDDSDTPPGLHTPESQAQEVPNQQDTWEVGSNDKIPGF